MIRNIKGMGALKATVLALSVSACFSAAAQVAPATAVPLGMVKDVGEKPVTEVVPAEVGQPVNAFAAKADKAPVVLPKIGGKPESKVESKIETKPEARVEKAVPKKPVAPAVKITKGESDTVKEFKAPSLNEMVVSSSEINRFIFPVAVKKLVFPTWFNVSTPPTYLAGNKQILVSFDNAVEKPVQMVVVLENDEVFTYWLKIRPVQGVVFKAPVLKKAEVDTYEVGMNVPRGNSPFSQDIKIIEKLKANQESLAGFEEVAIPRVAKFDKFSVVPLVSWSNKVDRKATVFQLIAAPGQQAVVSPSQFYRPGVTVVSIEGGDKVDATTSPYVYMVEEDSHE